MDYKLILYSKVILIFLILTLSSCATARPYPLPVIPRQTSVGGYDPIQAILEALFSRDESAEKFYSILEITKGYEYLGNEEAIAESLNYSRNLLMVLNLSESDFHMSFLRSSIFAGNTEFVLEEIGNILDQSLNQLDLDDFSEIIEMCFLFSEPRYNELRRIIEIADSSDQLKRIAMYIGLMESYNRYGYRTGAAELLKRILKEDFVQKSPFLRLSLLGADGNVSNSEELLKALKELKLDGLTEAEEVEVLRSISRIDDEKLLKQINAVLKQPVFHSFVSGKLALQAARDKDLKKAEALLATAERNFGTVENQMLKDLFSLEVIKYSLFMNNYTKVLHSIEELRDGEIFVAAWSLFFDAFNYKFYSSDFRDSVYQVLAKSSSFKMSDNLQLHRSFGTFLGTQYELSEAVELYVDLFNQQRYSLEVGVAGLVGLASSYSLKGIQITEQDYNLLREATLQL